jgi:CheY-like chemotaxis protein
MGLVSDAPRELEPDKETSCPETECKGRVLVVEDNPTMLEALRVFLEGDGYEVTPATSLAEAVGCARENPSLNAVVTDYHLSGGTTGRQVIAALREIRGRDFRAIVITGDTFAAVHAFDGDPYLSWLRKPIEPQQLLLVLRKFLDEPRSGLPYSPLRR